MNQPGKDDLDQQLKQLAIVAQQYAPRTPQRQLALGQLVQMILKSGRLCRPQRGKFAHCYEEIYQEARQELLFFVCQHIDKYAPERGDVMAWCNVLLERRFFREAIPKVLDQQGIQKVSLSDLDNLALPEEPPVIAEIVKGYIESDPENLFKTSYIQEHPEANFQALAKQRLEGKSWQEISEKFEIKVSTLSRFYQRSLSKFSPNIKKYVENI